MAVYQYNTPYVSEFINLQPIRNIYNHSSQLSNYNQVNLRTGDSTVVKKAPIPAEGRAGTLKIAKQLEFLHLDHADPRRGSIFV